MQYVGGKQKSGGHHIAKLVRELSDAEGCAEPFCGGLSVTYRLEGLRVQASDACRPLITLYREMKNGWVPPDDVDQETWERYKDNPDPDDPMTAFVGFGCSRSGSWFSGFVVDYKFTQRRVPAAVAAKQSLLRKLSRCDNVDFRSCDFEDAVLAPVVYCDPPYVGRVGYAAVSRPWDADRFWNWVREQSRSRIVLVSEMNAPEDFVAVLSWSVQSRIATSGGGRRDEHVFVHESLCES